MERHAALTMISSRVAAALVTTVAGILVAVPATCFYNYLRARIDLLESEASNDSLAGGGEYRQIAPRFLLRKRFSEPPAFALIGAPTLAILVVAYTTFASFHPPTGFGIELASGRCEYDGDEPHVVLHLTGTGGLLLNTEHETWNTLADRLSDIYSTRVHRTLYLFADNGLPYQTVAEVIDIIENSPVAAGSDKLNITVRLITSTAMTFPCPKSVVTGSSRKVVGDKRDYAQNPGSRGQ
jgi:biopolymer transport protein ExbD